MAIKILNFHYSEIGKREALCLRVVHTESPEGPYSAIVRYFGAFDFMGHFCLVLELCQGGSLQTHIRPLDSTTSTSSSSATNMKSHEGLSLEQIREASLHLVKALLLLHNHDVIHADIKPENVLLLFNNKSSSSSSSTTASSNSSSTSLLGNDVRLTDLGNAIKSREVKLYKEDYEIQTLGYRAPEVLMGGANGKAFDHQIDMWSLGVLLVELFLGRPLFRAASTMLMVKRIVSVLGECISMVVNLSVTCFKEAFRFVPTPRPYGTPIFLSSPLSCLYWVHTTDQAPSRPASSSRGNSTRPSSALIIGYGPRLWPSKTTLCMLLLH